MLDEVAVRPLRAVVQVHGLLPVGRGGGDLRLLGVDLGHGDLGPVTVWWEAEGEPGREEGGGCGGEEDVATEAGGKRDG